MLIPIYTKMLQNKADIRRKRSKFSVKSGYVYRKHVGRKGVTFLWLTVLCTFCYIHIAPCLPSGRLPQKAAKRRITGLYRFRNIKIVGESSVSL